MESVLFPVDVPATNTLLVICSAVRSIGSDSIWMANIVIFCVCGRQHDILFPSSSFIKVKGIGVYNLLLNFDWQLVHNDYM